MITVYSNEIKKIIGLSALICVLLAFVYVSAEPQLTSAVSATDSVIVTLNVEAGITITSPADSSMSRPLGVANNTAIGTTTWNVKTNNNLGYTLALKSSTNPAMDHSTTTDVIANYSEGTPGTPETWSVASGAAEFGYSAFGGDVNTTTWGTDSDCFSTAHVNSTTLKYAGLLTSDKTVATRSSTTTPTGVDTTVCYAVQQNNFYIPAGTYTATVTATATTL